MTRWLLFVGVAAVVLPVSAYAQAPPNARVLASCGTAGYPLGFGIMTMDQTGTLCSESGGGGGGGAVTIADGADVATGATADAATTAGGTGTLSGKLRLMTTQLASIITNTGGELTSTNDSTTISVTNTFQSIQVLTAARRGCVIQNNSGTADTQWVFFGAIGSATKATSVLLPPAGSVSCSTPSGVLTDQISITGTSGDSFYAAVQ